jgi:hypothetical protein
MPYWCAQIEGNREAVAERFLQMAGYSVYYPRIFERKRVRPLFPSYIFVGAALQWHKARWTVGVVRIVAGNCSDPACRVRSLRSRRLGTNHLDWRRRDARRDSVREQVPICRATVDGARCRWRLRREPDVGWILRIELRSPDSVRDQGDADVPL